MSNHSHGRAPASAQESDTELDTGRDIVVVGASAGGVEALVEFVRGLPENLAAAVLIVLHVPPTETSVLPRILQRNTPLPVTHARDRDPIELGHLYVAPPDRHLLVHDGELRLVRGPRENNHRPAVDPLFRSAAASYGSRVVGVVLSGSLDDGAAGMQAIARVRGVRIVQDPDEALYRGMPESAIMADAPDYVIPLAEISAIVTRLASEPIEEVEAGMENGELERENRFTVLASGVEDEPSGRPSLFSCPECSGVLFETDDKGLLRYRCRIGHAYNVESLHAAQSNEIDAALGAALRALEERAVLSRRLAERLSRSGAGAASRRYAARADEAEESATLLRRVMAAQSGAADEGTGS